MGCVYKYPCLQVFVEYTDVGDTGNTFVGDSLHETDLTGILQNTANEENNTNIPGNSMKSNSDTQINNKGNEMLGIQGGNPHIPGIGTKISNIPGRSTLGNISSSNIQHSTINGVYSNRTVEAQDNITSNNNRPIINTKQTGQTISPNSKSPSNGLSDNELSENRATDSKLSVIGLVDIGLSENRLSDSDNRLSEKGLPRQYLSYDPHRNSKKIAERLTEKYPAPSNLSNTSSKYSLLYRRWGDSFYNTVSVTVQKCHYPPANHHAIHL